MKKRTQEVKKLEDSLTEKEELLDGDTENYEDIDELEENEDIDNLEYEFELEDEEVFEVFIDEFGNEFELISVNEPIDADPETNIEDIVYTFRTNGEVCDYTLVLDNDEFEEVEFTFEDQEGNKIVLQSTIDIDDYMPSDFEEILDDLDNDMFDELYKEDDGDDIDNLTDTGYFNPFTGQVSVVIDPTEIYNSKTVGLTEEDIFKSAVDLSLSIDPSTLDDGQQLLHSAIMSWIDKTAKSMLEPSEIEEIEKDIEFEIDIEDNDNISNEDGEEIEDDIDEEDELEEKLGVMESMEFRRVKPNVADRKMWLEKRYPYAKRIIHESYKRGIFGKYLNVIKNGIK